MSKLRGFFEASNYALARSKEGISVLIDKSGKVVTAFYGYWDYINFAGDEKGRYFRMNDVWYDAFGNKVKE
ncbi:hypothetical protein [Campylobacter sp. CCUG 57310]|uniref:hypothetical protein n=1 Tax=Campylobacter sp. CCUG 57310 TaxID=2517362 RepID=UPI0015660466|nr:hypothetical protein [Campylobacter sp. CCUG 57310]